LLVGERLRGHRDDHFAAIGELHRVGEHVEQDLAQARDVALTARARRPRRVGRVEVLLGGARGHEVERRFHAVAQVEGLRLDVHAPGLDLREVEDVVDDGEQRVARVADRRA
jgi:hypothetical protein